MTTDPTAELMELVRQASGCTYLSDLHNAASARDVLCAVQRIPVRQYPAAAWSELVNYILQQQESYATGEDAVSALAARKES